MTVTVRPLAGAGLAAALDDLAALRITVFAAFPYLYDGDAAYEARYLADFAEAPGAVLVAAFDGDRVIGAATASPLAAQDAGFLSPFTAAGIDPGDLFYFGESVLLSEYRGQGIGHAFFDAREAAARAAGATGACFAAVIRAGDHPARPADHRPLDGFWTKRGYAPVPGLTVTMDWREHGEAGESAKALQVWLRRWDA